jgi:Flp pilus assembly protein TadD
MVADSNREWDRAESFYETAVGLTTRPAGVLNNWGFSRLTRGDHDGAEELFLEAISYDPNSSPRRTTSFSRVRRRATTSFPSCA